MAKIAGWREGDLGQRGITQDQMTSELWIQHHDNVASRAICHARPWHMLCPRPGKPVLSPNI